MPAADHRRAQEIPAFAANIEHAGDSVDKNLRDLKRVNTHLVAAAAYPVLEGKGELLPSRIRQAGADGEA